MPNSHRRVDEAFLEEAIHRQKSVHLFHWPYLVANNSQAKPFHGRIPKIQNDASYLEISSDSAKNLQQHHVVDINVLKSSYNGVFNAKKNMSRKCQKLFLILLSLILSCSRLALAFVVFNSRSRPGNVRIPVPILSLRLKNHRRVPRN